MRFPNKTRSYGKKKKRRKEKEKENGSQHGTEREKTKMTGRTGIGSEEKINKAW